MKSIYQRALGSAFDRLHPRIQQRFALTSVSGHAAIGRGRVDRIWHGRFYTLPFLYVGTWRNIMFPERGHDVPFEIENWAYRDSLGRETVTWLRTFHTGHGRRFDAYMITAKAAAGSLTTLALTNIWLSIWIYQSTNGVASFSAPASSVSTRVPSLSGSRPSSLV